MKAEHANLLAERIQDHSDEHGEILQTDVLNIIRTLALEAKAAGNPMMDDAELERFAAGVPEPKEDAGDEDTE